MNSFTNNVITHGLSGKQGNVLVFSQRDRLTSDSLLQKNQQVVIYRNQQNISSDFEIAIADMLQAPDIEKIDMSNYRGLQGDQIKITVTYELQAADVRVSIYNPDDTLAEEGIALRSENEIEWIYTIQSSSTLPGDKIVIVASDVAGNRSTEEKLLS
ncbi:hypothetical protein [Pedobacter sp. SYSU D00535]|uniref:hypothetical protein n=1 Tax=Pedobacter sp. SYSU D00535 TaxID=2810308 RepID=UPI001A963ACF|nr:hypothetical protein [Pedobacter sp. SYSU D00535]